MKLTDKEIQKIKFDALVERRLREIQTIANLEIEIRYFEKMKLLGKVDLGKIAREISIRKAEIEVHKEMIKILDEIISENG
jgi:hypothetical protein